MLYRLKRDISDIRKAYTVLSAKLLMNLQILMSVVRSL
jgi:hypothetical protein